jgi:hypothetical protein
MRPPVPRGRLGERIGLRNAAARPNPAHMHPCDAQSAAEVCSDLSSKASPTTSMSSSVPVKHREMHPSPSRTIDSPLTLGVGFRVLGPHRRALSPRRLKFRRLL